MKKSVKIVLAAASALPIVVAAAVPLFVNANTFRPIVESRLSAALSRKVTLGDLSLSVMKGSLVANDLAIAEDPKFGQTPFFTAKRLHIGVQMKPLIFHHELLVRSFEVDAPQIHLIRAEDGTWNFSTLSHGTDSLNTTRSTTLPDLPVDQITIKDGNAKMETLPLQKNPQVYDHLYVELEHFSLGQAFPFTVSASLPGDGKVEVSGTVGPINPQDAAFTTFNTQVKIQHLDPVAAGYVDPAAGISMIGGLDAHIASDGVNVTSDGKVHAEQLILLKGGKAAPYPIDVSYQVVHSLRSNSGQVSDLVFQTGAIAIHIKGNYQLAANVPVFDLKLLAQSVPINDLQALMPAVGVKLPNGATLKGGTLSADFTIKGSPTDNVIVGSYEIKNTKLVGYDLGSKIAGIAALGGIKTGDTTVIDISRANVRITKSGSESTKIYSVLPALGESTGSGTVSPSGALDFHLISKVTSAKGLNKVGVNLLTKLNSTSDTAKPSTATGIPISITGTAEEPVITADVNGLMKGNAATIKKKLSKLFGKKQ
ncbi:AsmA family protein [Tunturiibacter gelidoferens]|uniref:AsmA protein n=1 Tax=Tunturiibacter gelidiferens TaxID=3069689 RepID=A0A9X0U3D0_9BACT|nr:AsmA family protein [Edaphobacter lichenicola]MBB5328281.1 AsmA protein [Edaphobacter lichenicola]